jgi:PIN like domain
MTAVAAEVRFFADESVLGLGKALTIARRDFIHSGHPLIPRAPVGALDTEWIPEVADRKLIVVARDKRIRTKPAELRLLREHGLRVFWIAGKRDLATWDYLVRVVRRWDEIERRIASQGAGPWFVAINDGNLTDIPLS